MLIYKMLQTYGITLQKMTKLLQLILVVAAVLAVVRGEDDFQRLRLAPPDSSYKILVVLPGMLKSHELAMTPLMTALANRGHQVSVLGATSTNLHPNITRYHYNASVFEEYINQPWFDHVTQPTKTLTMGKNFVHKFTLHAFESPDVKHLYSKREEFDMIIMDDVANLGMYPLVHEKIFALYSNTVMNPVQSAALGNIHSPAYLATPIEDYPRPFSTINRLKNLLLTFGLAYIWKTMLRSDLEVELSRRFPNLPSSFELESNASVMFINSNSALDGSVALLPNQVMVGGMRLRAGRPLPEDLNTFLASNKAAIYVSFGSLVMTSGMPESNRKIIFSVFWKLPYKIILKFGGATQEEQSHENILIQNWLPQLDVLAHPKTKLFVSHCGTNGINEAIFFAVPLICLPVVGDQKRIASTVHHKGIGIRLSWSSLTEEILYNSILEILTDPGYQSRIDEMSRVFRDQPETPLERAVFWTEFAIKHSGTKHLKSLAKDLSWIEIFYLDILLLVFIFFHIALNFLTPKIRRIGSFFYVKFSHKLTRKQTSFKKNA